MSRPVISVDIDDVLADNAASFVAFSNQLWGTNLTPDDYEDDWAHMWQVDYEEAARRVAEYFGKDHVYRYRHDAAALDVLLRLKESYDLIVVTARRIETKGDTLRWIKEYYPGIFEEDKIYFAGIWETLNEGSIFKDKGELLKSLGANYHIDDQIKHTVGAQQQGIQAILFGEYSWNKPDVDFPKSIVRARNWADVQGYFDAL